MTGLGPYVVTFATLVVKKEDGVRNALEASQLVVIKTLESCDVYLTSIVDSRETVVMNYSIKLCLSISLMFLFTGCKVLFTYLDLRTLLSHLAGCCERVARVKY